MRDHLNTVEAWISGLLRWGVLLCSAIIAIGWLISLFHGSGPGAVGLKELSKAGEPQSVSWIPSLNELPSQIRAADSNAIIVLGLFLLISLPILRVVLAAFVFLIQRDYIYLLFSSIVLSFLLFGFMWGRIL